MTKKRTTRKQLLKEPDEFITLTGRMIEWGRSNRRPLILVACALVIGLGVFAAQNYYRDTRGQTAATLMSQSMAAYHQKSIIETDPATKLAAVRSDFERLITRYHRYPAGRLARLHYAHINLAGGDLDTAIRLYEKALADFGKDASLRVAIINGLAEAHARRGDIAIAIAHYEKILDGNQAMFVDATLFQLGRLYRLAGDPHKSDQAYARLQAEFPDSLFAEIARERKPPQSG